MREYETIARAASGRGTWPLPASWSPALWMPLALPNAVWLQELALVPAWWIRRQDLPRPGPVQSGTPPGGGIRPAPSAVWLQEFARSQVLVEPWAEFPPGPGPVKPGDLPGGGLRHYPRRSACRNLPGPDAADRAIDPLSATNASGQR